MTSRSTKPLSKKSLRELANLKDEKSRKKYFTQTSQKLTTAAVQQLNEESRAKLRIDPQQSLALAEAAVVLAGEIGDTNAVGCSFRAKGNALYNVGQNSTALDYHAQALQIFRDNGMVEEEARTLNASIQPHILLGEYDEALQAAEGARVLFRSTGDTRRLGHVELNVGNIYHRQDRFEEALQCYERAYETLTPLRDSEGLAITLYNMAVTLITLNDFQRALATYQRARDMFVKHGMTLLVTQSDYNIAYLYYLRGEYSRAIQMLRATRIESEKNGDAHVLALCFLDLSEIYLELNMSRDAREIAHEGYLRFQKLGMGYEEAKCLANEAMAASQLGKALGSLELFAKARQIFAREKNSVWPSLIDLYQSVVLCDEGRLFEAKRLCKKTADFFEKSPLHGKAAFCHLLLSRIAMHMADLETAKKECGRALERVAGLESPSLNFQGHFLMGRIQQEAGDLAGAYASYQTARTELENLRSNLRGEELKISFMKNRLEVYECLVELCLNDAHRPGSAEEAFEYIELAKSRSLAELLLQPGASFASTDEGQSEMVRHIREMREELNWYYRRIEKEQLSGETSSARVQGLQKEVVSRENDMIRVLRELRASESPSKEGIVDGIPSLETVREALPYHAVLVEYFVVKEHFVAAVVTRDSLRIVGTTPLSRAANLVRLLRFQLAKFALGADYIGNFEETLAHATRTHLHELYRELIAPLRKYISASHLILVPHGLLHSVPFHALFDGEKYLIDHFSVSYAPSAGVYAICERKMKAASQGALVLGVPDERAPLIEEEVRSVAKIVPNSRLVIGAEPAGDILRTEGASYRLIHIATHGKFRQDNPMFSGIRLGPSYLSLYDLYQLQLHADLVTLSGCATGLNVITTGDELLGLTRGLLYAGARSLLLTLWDVHDQSTSHFMSSFYARISRQQDRATAFQEATQELRERYSHPFHWAPFTLTGKIFGA